LVCQGAESFYQWRGIKPQTQSVIKELRLSL
jgi:shikimate 5-dehydrogenase